MKYTVLNMHQILTKKPSPQEPASKDDVWIFDDGNDIHPTAQEGM